MKSALVKYLVAEQDFSLIMLEATFGEVVYLNQFIQGERTDVDEVLKGMPLWFFKVEEFRELLIWLRDYNQGHKNRVQLYGMEMQYVDRSLHHIQNYLMKTGSHSHTHLVEFGHRRIGSATKGAEEFYFLWQRMPDDVLKQHLQLLVKLREAFSEKKPQLIEKSSLSEFELAYRHVVLLEQFVSAMMQSEEAIKHQMRDYFMYLNVNWSRAHLQNPKTVVWAHNEHIWKQAGNGGYDVLGRQLDRRFGESYYAIGFDFGRGTYRAPSSVGWEHLVPKPVPGTLTQRMSELGNPNYLLSIRSAMRATDKVPETAVLRASSGGYTPMQNGSLQFDREYSLRDRYDALLFVSEVSPPRILN